MHEPGPDAPLGDAERIVRRFAVIGRVGGWSAVLVGVIVLGGWALEVRRLQSIAPTWQTTKPWTATVLLLSGVAVLSMTSARRRCDACAAAVVVIAVAALAEYATGWSPGYDTWLFGPAVRAEGVEFPGRMAIMTAVAFALLGAGFLLHAARRTRAAQVLWLGVFAIGAMACVGYLFDATQLYEVSVYSSVALPTSLGLVVLSTAALASTVGTGLLAIVVDEGTAGVLVRRLLPLALLAIVFLAELGQLGRIQGAYGEEFSDALVVLATLVIVAAMIVLVARQLASAERDRRAAEERLRELNTTLEARVEATTLGLRESEAHFRSLTGMLDALNAAGSDPRVVVEAATRHLAEEAGDACFIVLLDDAGTHLVSVASSHRDPQRKALLEELLATTPIRVGEGLTGEVAATGRPVIISEATAGDIRARLHPGYRAYLDEIGLSGVLLVPLETDGRVIGVLALGREGPGRPFTDFDLELAAEMAVRIALGIDRARLHDQLQASEERFRTTFEDAPLGMAILEVGPGSPTRWIDVNDALVGLLGYPRDDLLAGPVGSRLHPDDHLDLDLDRMPVWPVRHHQRDLRVRHADGHHLWVRVTASLIGDQGRAATSRLIVQIEDVSHRREVEDRLAHAALHDTLTALPNRSLLADRMAQQIDELRRSHGLVALLLIDLDRFKSVNDSFGHDAGDRLLVEVADRMRRLARPLDTAARLSGDEFVVVCGDLGDEADALDLADRFRDGLSGPFEVGGRVIDVSVSIGVAVTGDPGHDPAELLRAADVAMYQAKAKGQGHIGVYDEAVARTATDRLRVEACLRDALDHGRFRLLYQPIVELDQGAVIGFEALLRLDDPERGLLAPAEFLEVAEVTGLIVPIGAWVVREACRQLARWEHDLGVPPNLTVNLSGRQVGQGDLGDIVVGAIEDSGADPSHLCLEITETVFMGAAQSVVQLLLTLKERGIRLAIDDFGTGYSSLTYLQQFPVDFIKIDRSFTCGLDRRAADTAIVDAIINLGRSLDLGVIAEGVETEGQVESLRRAGCHLVQGHLFSPAVPAERATELLLAGIDASG